jgi:hypothetical protein
MEIYMEQQWIISKSKTTRSGRNIWKTVTENMQPNQIKFKQKTPSENKNYPRVKNTTNIQFTQNGMQLLRKGLKYHLHY